MSQQRQSKLTVLKSILLSALCIATCLIPVAQAGTVTYLHNDALGSAVAATNEQGDVLWREAYRPYGERIRKEVSNNTHNVWFTGKPEEATFGLSYFGARWYDPKVGRFMAVDPVGFKEGNIQSFNRYAYANNNPYKYVDPDGESGISVLFSPKPVLVGPPKPSLKGLTEPGRSFTPEQLVKYVDRIQSIKQSKQKPGVKNPDGRVPKAKIKTPKAESIRDTIENAIKPIIDAFKDGGGDAFMAPPAQPTKSIKNWFGAPPSDFKKHYNNKNINASDSVI